MARKVAGAKATLLDLPEVIEQSKKIIAQEEESVRSRIDTKGMSATFGWGVEDGSYDAVLQSYLASSVPSEALPGLYEKAFNALKPGGRMIVHDFIVNNSMKGLNPSMICKWLGDAGFESPRVQEMIGGATKVI